MSGPAPFSLPIPTASGPLTPPHKEADVNRKYAWAIAVLTTVVLVPAAAPAAQAPLIKLAPITILNGTATVAVTIGPQPSAVVLNVNGKPLGINSAGVFAGTIDLKGANTIALALSRPATGVVVTFRIPILGRTMIRGDVLAGLLNTGLSILQPVAKPGQPVTVNGSFLDGSQLVSLDVNGVDALGMLQGSTFEVPLPADTGQVQVSAGGANGTTEVINAPVFRPFSTSTVSASSAVGLRIANIRYVRKGVRRTHRIRMIVTVRDVRGRLVRGATIRVTAKGHKLIRRPRATRSGVKGRATIGLRLKASAYGKRLVTVTVAKTPHAKAKKRSAVRVPAKH
jgi:hypothetical protein